MSAVASCSSCGKLLCDCPDHLWKGRDQGRVPAGTGLGLGLGRDPAFLLYYASVLEREAESRPNQNVAWMLAGAARARAEAVPDQGSLAFGAAR